MMEEWELQSTDLAMCLRRVSNSRVIKTRAEFENNN
eukprot:CAMPEP_0203854986 /NCGR_PEP_ID=MMETSP0359-20131031/9390_1 /ASSEMBLY_ACC=CAM_ASM_000338 /TAXON_ID=268821 /ORGANISM="Scrippsiella Hangoei, Strain SHTV-5" /LENGTH=35 /DNA_ID= /DNA_START= /DNA_END= /DNA_ORIENTATION=